MSTITTLGPVGFNPTGAYDSTRQYEKLDVVYYQGSSYVAIADSLGQVPTNAQYWDCIALGTLKQFTYDNVASMKLDNSLEDGKVVETIGYYSANDGGGATYKVRTKTVSDVIDDMTIISLANNTIIAELIIEDEMNIKQLGAKSDNTTDISSQLTKLFKLSANTLVIPSGTYKVNDIININQITNKLIKNFGTLNFDSSAERDNSCFELKECNNLTFDGFIISSTRDKNGFPPSGHTRVTSYSSNRSGFKLLKCENITILNSNFNNMEYDIRITRRTADPENTYLNKNIVIDGVYSRNGSQPVYAQNIDGLYINNCDIITAEDLGDGDHILYVAQYSKNIHWDNSILKAGNKYYGVLFNIQEAAYNTDIAAPVDFYANNIICSGYELIGTKSITKVYLSKIIFNMIDLDGDTNQCVINNTGTSYVYIDNCTLNTTKQIVVHYKDTPHIIIKNSSLKGVTERNLFAITTAGSCDILLQNCIIDTTKAVVYIANGISNSKVILENCIVNNTSDYVLSNRNPSGNNIIRTLNCYFKDTYASTSYIAYNGSGNDMTGFELLNTFFYGFTNVGYITTNCLAINSYKDNTLITIS